MRKLLKLTLLVLLTSFTAANAQTAATINGKIEDGTGRGMESTTVSLLRGADSSVVKMIAADKEGQFRFEAVPNGRYLVSATAVGYQVAYSDAIAIENASAVSLKSLQLQPAAKALSGVTVTTKRPLIEQQVDRMIVNVDASPTNVGNSALEILEKSPGITVDKDGNISLKGKQGVVVLIDGRPTQLSGTDLANLLRTMTSTQLDQIEIMTNPPAKYDAAGNAGVINI